MSEDALILSKVLEKISTKAKNTSSKTEKIKYICALLSLEERLYEYSSALSNECSRRYNEIINDWHV